MHWAVRVKRMRLKENLDGRRKHRSQGGWGLGAGSQMQKVHQREAVIPNVADVRGGPRITTGPDLGGSAWVTGTKVMTVEGLDRQPDCRRLLREKEQSKGCWYHYCLGCFVAKEAKLWEQHQSEANRALCFAMFLEAGGGQHVCVLAEMVKSSPGVARKVGARAVLKRPAVGRLQGPFKGLWQPRDRCW